MGIGDRDYMRSGSRFRMPSIGVIPAIIAINVVVFIVWQVSEPPTDRRLIPGNPELYSALMDNFTVSYDAMRAGRVWTLLTAAFSHMGLLHLFLNMFILHGFGRVLEERWGSRRFLGFYLIAALISSAAHPLFTALGWSATPALGASGAIAACVVCFALYYPKATLLFMLVIPMPAWFLVIAITAWDLWGLIEQRGKSGGGIGHAVHLGGAAVGAIYVLFIERRRIRLGRVLGRSRPRGRVLTPSESPWSVPERRGPPGVEETRLDELLEKVSRGGLDSLSMEEREQLERISEKRRQGRL